MRQLIHVDVFGAYAIRPYKVIGWNADIHFNLRVLSFISEIEDDAFRTVNGRVIPVTFHEACPR